MKAKIIMVPVKQTTPSGDPKRPQMATIATQIPMATSKTHAFDDPLCIIGFGRVGVGGVELPFEVVEQPPFPQSQHDSHPFSVCCKCSGWA